MINIFLDDNKNPEWFRISCEYFRFFNAVKALEFIIQNNHEIDKLFLDNDLGKNQMEGYDFLKKLIKINKKPQQVIIISFNSVARERIANLCDDNKILCI
jgi:two-component SAPR family response regulator